MAPPREEKKKFEKWNSLAIMFHQLLYIGLFHLFGKAVLEHDGHC